MNALRRRTILAAGPAFAILPNRARAAEWTARQFHNQPEDSHQHRFLVDLWSAVREQTGGRLDVAASASFRRKLGAGFYTHWKNRVGTSAWALLEDQVGQLA